MKNKEFIVDVSGDGAVILGPDVVCDGFYFGPEVRLQSHIHSDHMNEFDRSKGFQKIWLSPESYDLLILEKNADIPLRCNIKPIDYNKSKKVGSSELSILSSGHMLGAVQTEVILEDGKRVGYSSDFSWPLEKVIKVDKLILDSTYGNQNRICHYSLEDARMSLVELVSRKVIKNPILLIACRGTLQNIMYILNDEINFPFVCEQNIYEEIKIYNKFGYNLKNVFSMESKDSQNIIDSGSYIYIRDTRNINPSITDDNMVKIKISAFRNIIEDKEPIQKLSNKAYTISLSGHADFNGILEYVSATGAKEIITDNTRGGHAVDLALAIKDRLGIYARPSDNKISNNFGEHNNYLN